MQPMDTSMPLFLSIVMHSQAGPDAITRLGLIPTTPKRMADSNAIKAITTRAFSLFTYLPPLRIPKGHLTRGQCIVDNEICQYFWRTRFLLQT
jgi:hypothetical protein